MKTNKPIFLVAILLFFALFAYHVHAEACQVYDTQTNTVLPDTDCDVYPDTDDTCPSLADPDQRDSDGDGIGDACERQIPRDENRSPIRVVDSVGIQMTGRVASLESSSNLNAALMVTYTTSHSLDAGGPGEFYEIRIKNTGSEVALVTMNVQGIVGWGTYSLKPSESISIQPGEEAVAFVFVRADYAADPGEKAFTVRLKSDSQETILTLYANVQQSVDSRWTLWESLNVEIGLILIIVLVLIIGIIAGTVHHWRKSQGKVE